MHETLSDDKWKEIGRKVPGRRNSAQSAQGKSDNCMSEGLKEAECGSSIECDREKRLYV